MAPLRSQRNSPRTRLWAKLPRAQVRKVRSKKAAASKGKRGCWRVHRAMANRQLLGKPGWEDSNKIKRQPLKRMVAVDRESLTFVGPLKEATEGVSAGKRAAGAFEARQYPGRRLLLGDVRKDPGAGPSEAAWKLGVGGMSLEPRTILPTSLLSARATRNPPKL